MSISFRFLSIDVYGILNLLHCAQRRFCQNLLIHFDFVDFRQRLCLNLCFQSLSLSL